MEQHAIAFDKEGRALDLASERPLSPSDFERHVDGIIDGIKSFRASSHAGGRTRLFLYVHGAMNTIGGANKRAAKNYEAVLRGGKYPIFVNWEAGIVSAYFEHLLWVRQGRKAKAWGLITAIFYLLYDLLQVVVRSFMIWGWQIKNRFAGETSLGTFEKNAIWTHARLREAFEREASGDGILRVSPKGNTPRIGLVAWVYFAFATLVFMPFRLLFAPFIAAFGTSAWVIYRRRTFNLFRKPAEFDVRDLVKRKATVLPPAVRTGDLARFLDALIERLGSPHARLGASPDEVREAFREHYAIELAGHSTGAIILNNLVNEYPDLHYPHITYMGAACTVRDMVQTVIPYLRRTPDARLSVLTLDPRAEMRENIWWFLPVLPPGSLLEWLDAYLTSPPQNLDRVLGKWTNVMAAQQVFSRSVRSRVTLKKFDYHVAGQPQKHGAFDDHDDGAGNAIGPFHDEAYWSVPDPQTEPNPQHADPRPGGDMPRRSR